MALTAAGDPVAGTDIADGDRWGYLAAPVVVSGDTDTSDVFVVVYDYDLELEGLTHP